MVRKLWTMFLNGQLELQDLAKTARVGDKGKASDAASSQEKARGAARTVGKPDTAEEPSSPTSFAGEDSQTPKPELEQKQEESDKEKEDEEKDKAKKAASAKESEEEEEESDMEDDEEDDKAKEAAPAKDESGSSTEQPDYSSSHSPSPAVRSPGLKPKSAAVEAKSCSKATFVAVVQGKSEPVTLQPAKSGKAPAGCQVCKGASPACQGSSSAACPASQDSSSAACTACPACQGSSYSCRKKKLLPPRQSRSRSDRLGGRSTCARPCAKRTGRHESAKRRTLWTRRKRSRDRKRRSAGTGTAGRVGTTGAKAGAGKTKTGAQPGESGETGKNSSGKTRGGPLTQSLKRPALPRPRAELAASPPKRTTLTKARAKAFAKWEAGKTKQQCWWPSYARATTPVPGPWRRSSCSWMTSPRSSSGTKPSSRNTGEMIALISTCEKHVCCNTPGLKHAVLIHLQSAKALFAVVPKLRSSCQ